MKFNKEVRKLSRQLFQASFTDGRLDPAKVKAITAKVIEAKPRHFIDVLKNYQRLVRLETEKHHAVIESAGPLDRSTSEQLENNLRSKYGRDLTTEFKISPDLIGGLRIKLGSDVWDGTIRNRLDRLQNQLAQI
jgi:F-type H+-transporting ATPase subunit delta